MKFRPCIDIHHGKVRQIVGGSLKDESDQTDVNFTSSCNAAWYAKKYAADGLLGGHIIVLDPKGSDWYEEDLRQARAALAAAPGTLQIGGGITPENAEGFLAAGATHVIVTSYVFQNGRLDYDRLSDMQQAVGREHLVLDLSCRQRSSDGAFVVVTDRWQTWTDTVVSARLFQELSCFCEEFLVHAADVEGRQAGPQRQVAEILGTYCAALGAEGAGRVTYAGGIRSFEDLSLLRTLGRGLLDVTIGSALDLFGGSMPYRDVLAHLRRDL